MVKVLLPAIIPIMFLGAGVLIAGGKKYPDGNGTKMPVLRTRTQNLKHDFSNEAQK
jgi:hypothetical protein